MLAMNPELNIVAYETKVSAESEVRRASPVVCTLFVVIVLSDIPFPRISSMTSSSTPWTSSSPLSITWKRGCTWTTAVCSTTSRC